MVIIGTKQILVIFYWRIKVEEVGEFTYLGSLIDTKCSSAKEKKRHCQANCTQLDDDMEKQRSINWSKNQTTEFNCFRYCTIMV